MPAYSQKLSSYFDDDSATGDYLSAMAAFGEQESPAAALGLLGTYTKRPTEAPPIPEALKHKPFKDMTVREAKKRLHYENWMLVEEHRAINKMYHEHESEWPCHTELRQVSEIKKGAMDALWAVHVGYRNIKGEGRKARIEKARHMHKTTYFPTRNMSRITEQLNAKYSSEVAGRDGAEPLHNRLPKPENNAYKIVRWCFRSIRQIMMI